MELDERVIIILIIILLFLCSSSCWLLSYPTEKVRVDNEIFRRLSIMVSENNIICLMGDNKIELIDDDLDNINLFIFSDRKNI